MDAKKILIAIVCGVAVLLGIGYFVFEMKEGGFLTKSENETVFREEAIRFGIGSMKIPSENSGYYSDLTEWVSGRVDRKSVSIFGKNYGELNDMIKNGEIDVAFVCSGAYVRARRDFDLDILAAAVVDGKMTYNSYIIVPASSPVNTLADLRGKKFTFTDPLSNTGKLVPTYMLKKMGETPESFFGQVIFSGSHDASMKAVANGAIDGAAVDSLIFEYIKKRQPGLADLIKVIEISDPYAIQPIVARKDLDPSIKEEIRKSLLEMHLNAEGREILSNMDIERFEVISEDAYASIDEMLDMVE